jgi:ribosome-associated translation inhibitor RaiA
MQNFVENEAKTLMKNSGNSDVDLTVNLDIDTKAIAYGMMCSLYAKGELNDAQLDKAVRKLDSLLERDKRRKNNKHYTGASTPRVFHFPN